MLPDRVSNPGPLTYESGALLIALRGLAQAIEVRLYMSLLFLINPVIRPAVQMYRKNYCTTLGSIGVDSSIHISKMLKLYMMGKGLSGKLSCMVVRKLSKGEGKGEGEKELKQTNKTKKRLVEYI